jgi:glycosyltransferase involved in cell wall biosynthesis
MELMNVKILVVGDPASIHANRFVNLLKEIGYNVRIFHSGFNYKLEEHLNNTVVYVAHPGLEPVRGIRIKVCWPMEMDCFQWRWLYMILRRLYKGDPKDRSRELDLVKIIKKWKPDIVFSLKMQDEGYTVSRAREKMGKAFKSKWIHFNWGTDIEFFGKHADYKTQHLPRIKKVLSSCDFHIADCKRDCLQASEYGFRGISLGHSPANGGFDLDELQQIGKKANPARNVILIKGRQGGYVGKAFNVLASIQKVAGLLRNYKIRIIMPSLEVKGAAAFLSYHYGLDCKALPRLSYDYLLGLYASSRIAISASDVDGSPLFLLEAMAMGAFPIHSDMDSVREWIRDGENGLLFPVDDIDAIKTCITQAIGDDNLIKSAREINWEITRERMDRNKTREFIKDTIEKKVLRVVGR